MTLRVAIVADSHFSERSRFEECIRVHDFIAAEVARRDVHLVVHTGDVYDAKSTPAERAAVVNWVRDVGRTAALLIVRGNHDAIGDLPLLEKIRTGHGVRVEERAGVRLVETRAGKIAVGALAWPQTAGLAAALGHQSIEATGLAVGDALRAVIRGMGEELRTYNVPRLFAAHAMVRGSRTSTGQPLVGCDMEVGLDDLALARADAYALGHIHMPQSWDVAALPEYREGGHDRVAPVIYPGSPRRTAFGEVEEKGFVVLTFEGREVSVERVATPCAPMVLINARWDGESLVNVDGRLNIDEPGAEVRFRYVVPSDQRDAARAVAERVRSAFLASGAVSVKLEEEVIAETRARAPEIAVARTIADKLAAMYRHQGVEAERAESLIGRARSLEAA